MRSAARPTVGILADDLTGGADAAAPFLARGMSVLVVRDGGRPSGDRGVDVVAYVSNSRDAAPSLALDRVRDALGSLVASEPRLVLKKIDSTLRGHLGAELSVAREVLQPELVLVAPAFPAHGRQLLEGRLVLDGVRSDVPPLPSLLAQSGIDCEQLSLEDVRSSRLADRLRALQPGSVLVFDAARDGDLARVVAAGSAVGPGVLWVGSGGLAAALAASLGATRRDLEPTTEVGDGPVLLVVGSWSERARAQVARLSGICRAVPLEVDALLRLDTDRLIAQLGAALAEGVDVVVVPNGVFDPERSEAVARGLAQVVVGARRSYRGLVLTGGATAEAVLDGLGIGSFRLAREIEVGVPLGVNADGFPFVTKAGSFGDDTILERCRAALHDELARGQS